MDRHPQSLFPPEHSLRTHQSGHKSAAGRKIRVFSSLRDFSPDTNVKQRLSSSPHSSSSIGRWNSFRTPQKKTGGDYCCIMTPAELAMHPPECEECVQSCEDAGCTIELTPQCTDQCVVVCNDVHHGFESCVDASEATPFCPDGTDCSLIDELLCCAEYQPPSQDGKSFLGSLPNGAFPWDSFDHLFSAAESHNQTAHPLHHYTHPPTLPNMPSHNVHPMHHQHASCDPFSSSSVSAPGPSAYSTSSSNLANAASLTSPNNSSGSLQCMWGNCSATFHTMAELVGHVNLQHLRIPGTTPSVENQLTPNSTSSIGAINTSQADQFSCLWADCHQFPDVSTLPGSSTGNPVDSVLDVLANHLLHDHLGLTSPLSHRPTSGISKSGSPPTTSTPSSAPLISPRGSSISSKASSVSPSGPPTPAPEHDCSLPTHVCRWIGCGQTFVSCDELTAHITATHVGGGKNHYDCHWEGCTRHGDNGFASKQKICRHLQSHTGHRPFQCKICNQHFSEAATLAQHIRRHTQERPYVCDYPGCGKSFAITGALTIHKRTHNGHKPFKCTYCDRAFAESSNLSKHLRTHTGARPYSCVHPGCTKSFARPDQLARHMTVHRKKTADIPGEKAVEQAMT